jgi:hypothetical protein
MRLEEYVKVVQRSRRLRPGCKKKAVEDNFHGLLLNIVLKEHSSLRAIAAVLTEWRLEGVCNGPQSFLPCPQQPGQAASE